MKFGRRLLAEAARSKHLGQAAYLDYKALKKALKADIAAGDVESSHFSSSLVAELQKVSAFYSTRMGEAEARFKRCQDHACASELAQLRAELQELIKYVALNYQAVVKAIKKRNRHLKERFGPAAPTSLVALDLLLGEVFFTSPRLANLATQAELLARDLTSNKSSSSCSGSVACSHGQPSPTAVQAEQADAQERRRALLEEYTCPVCLDTLHNPVVLTCAHRFCWGCLVAHCTSWREMAPPSTSTPSTSTKPSLSEASSYRVLEHIASTSEPEAPTFYPCPICRKPQILDIDTLQVDTYLEDFVNNLRSVSLVELSDNKAPHTPAPTTTQHLVLPPPQEATATLATQASQDATASMECSSAPAAKHVAHRPRVREPWGVIPPPSRRHKGKLCVLLDLDGTLVSSFTPKRAPRLPSYIRTHIVGMGSKLNPQGVFVVERPGLTEFLEKLSAFAEVIIYTAGLEDYASPIIDAIDPHKRFFAGRIYRGGTLRTEHYQCVKDMARLNRDLKRTVLVDDTPLAFLHQPDNGVPVLGFRGDPDDRLLLEAVLPLLQALDRETDVTAVLRRRFDMGGWFKRHGFAVEQIVRRALANAAAERERHSRAQTEGMSSLGESLTSATHPHAPVPEPAYLLPPVQPVCAPSKDVLFLADFDHTLSDWDAGERLCEELAPELKPMLVGVECPASHVSVTNSVLSEVQRRGVSRDALLAALNDLGARELPRATRTLLQALHRARIDTKILSDANSVFILQILTGARVANLVTDIITNPASFERTDNSTSPQASPGRQATKQSANTAGYKLVVRPHHGSAGQDVSQCPVCPCNMCKGREVRNMRRAGTYRRIVFAGDGANDVCAALCLGAGDAVLARAGRPLAEYLARAARGEVGYVKPAAQWHLWDTHEDLEGLVVALTGA